MRHQQLALYALVASLWSFTLVSGQQHLSPRDSSCSSQDRTYSNEVPRAGSYQPWALIPFGKVGFPAKQYITIVNLTPHRFVLDKGATHSYQMDIFDWDDIPQGRSRQNVAKYTSKAGKNPVDDNGEAYYSIQGTNKKFMVRATTHIPDDYPRRTVFDLSGMGLGQREYSDPGKEAPVTLVITGSATYGFAASLRHGPGNWMRGLYDVIKDRPLRHLFLPGSHDAGMSRISGNLVSLGSAPNTQTQGITIYDQLRAGSRLFDLRVGTVHNATNTAQYGYWILHVNDERADVAIGNTGEALDEVIQEVNRFTAENPGEIILFRVRYLIGIRNIPSFGPIYWTADMVNEFFGKLRGVNDRCGGLDAGGTTFDKQPASYFMDRNGGRGCVLFLLDTSNLQDGVPHDAVADGIYRTEALPVWDNWSNLPDTQKVAEDQTAKWKTVSRAGAFANDQFLIGQWIISADPLTTTALTIEQMAVQPTNPALYWMGLNAMSPEVFPTVALVDYVGVVVDGRHAWDQLSAELYTLAVGMNLYMISENCDISKGRSPLLPPPPRAQAFTLSAPGPKQLIPMWNGIIYENGTIVNNPANGTHPGRVPILKSGTVFLNGTIVFHDKINPRFGTP
ncbi:LysM domain-containing protein [Cordyceps fumosorosea ARSEF 2679]|uniref:LysM domain-containing protein n=1 Tax=Cordyceps fumosorosea (strain ARSEF 2679) TaxID=1081104 RepID=A0A168D8H6_CORFA|nr:LysM domain-containing protein [Cordyceps fumosorosea ARSEF 2679]OAA72288.1 LysM domain-containing protein [Cordyceps fumosorosea ARSEF 2679]